MSYSDLRDFEPEATFEIPAIYRSDKPLAIEIEKVGGGEPGRPYAGTWRYRVIYDGRVMDQGEDLESGSEITHEGAAVVVADYLGSNGDPFDSYQGSSPVTDPEVRQMCEDNHDRLMIWAQEDDEPADEPDEPEEPVAYTAHRIEGGGDHVMLYTETNDDEDTGYPGKFAQWEIPFTRHLTRGSALEQAKRHVGGPSRQGIGHKVTVHINGVEWTSN